MTSTRTETAWRRTLAWLKQRPRAETAYAAVALYVLCTAAYFLFAAPSRLIEHTTYNHFAHLAEGWLQGRLDLADGPPDYAHNNDFAHYRGRWFVAFPPFPALILLPFVAIAGAAEGVRDGQVFIWIAGLGPALLFVALQRLSAVGSSQRRVWQNVVLALCFAFGTVYFFTVEQGTVWFAAHVLGVVLSAAYLAGAVNASFPLLAGASIGLGLLTRPPLAFAVPLFAVEALRVCGVTWPWTTHPDGTSPSSVRLGERLASALRSVQWRRLLRLYALFSLPIFFCLLFTFWHNNARFDDPFESGYQHLTVAWQARMKKWGLFHYHYLGKNLGVVLSSLPWFEPGKGLVRVNVHGLALWVTTPLYLWLVWPSRKPAIHFSLWLTVLFVAVPTLFYQNTGWAQFGYRFSNDYAVFLFALLAVGGRPLRGLFLLAASWSIAVNAFGAWTFDRGEFRRFYYSQGSQQILHQPD